MKRTTRLITILWVLMFVVSALSEGFLPPLNELMTVEMPNMENALYREADATEDLPDGSVQMTFLGIGKEQYTACSEYLGKSGCTVAGSSRSGSTVTVTLAKEDMTFTFTYDKDAQTIVAVYPEGTEAEARKPLRAGDYMFFGHYPQSAAGNDNTPIEWLVLDVQDGKALLQSRYGLDSQPYNTSYTTVTWEACSLRTWLNGTFLNKAFTAREQTKIVLTNVDNGANQGNRAWNTSGGKDTEDRIFLLSYGEANRYLGVTYINKNNLVSRVTPTAYAVQAGAYTSSSNKTAEGVAAGWWWLRSPGYNRSSAADVNIGGSLSGNLVNDSSGCVRPALWVSLESEFFYFEIDTSEDIPAEAVISSDVPVSSGHTLHTGETVMFGRYPQTASGGDSSPIEWLVLDVKDGKALLLSRYALDSQPYHTSKQNVTWEKCSLRTWLNETFFSGTFSAGEQKAIVPMTSDNSASQGYGGWNTSGGKSTQDRVFLLSYAEAWNFFDSSKARTCRPTEYALSRGAYQSVDGSSWWWLRSPGSSASAAARVLAAGSRSDRAVNSEGGAVRPAVYVDMSLMPSSASAGGSAASTGTPKPAATPKPATATSKPTAAPSSGDDTEFGELIPFNSKMMKSVSGQINSAIDLTSSADARSLLAALLSLEFFYQRPDMTIDASKAIYVGRKGSVVSAMFCTDRGYVAVFFEKSPFSTSYGLSTLKSASTAKQILTAASDQVWEVPLDKYNESLAALVDQLGS